MLNASESDEHWEDDEFVDEDWTDDDFESEDDDEEEVADCPECGKQVDLIANSCPHCGHWFLEEEKEAMERQARAGSESWRPLIILSGFIALLSAWVIWILSIIE